MIFYVYYKEILHILIDILIFSIKYSKSYNKNYFFIIFNDNNEFLNEIFFCYNFYVANY